MVVAGKFLDHRLANETGTTGNQDAHVLMLPLRLVPGAPGPSHQSLREGQDFRILLTVSPHPVPKRV
jgi:hypothetical protein